MKMRKKFKLQNRFRWKVLSSYRVIWVWTLALNAASNCRAKLASQKLHWFFSVFTNGILQRQIQDLLVGRAVVEKVYKKMYFEIGQKRDL